MPPEEKTARTGTRTPRGNEGINVSSFTHRQWLDVGPILIIGKGHGFCCRRGPRRVHLLVRRPLVVCRNLPITRNTSSRCLALLSHFGSRLRRELLRGAEVASPDAPGPRLSPASYALRKLFEATPSSDSVHSISPPPRWILATFHEFLNLPPTGESVNLYQVARQQIRAFVFAEPLEPLALEPMQVAEAKAMIRMGQQKRSNPAKLGSKSLVVVRHLPVLAGAQHRGRGQDWQAGSSFDEVVLSNNSGFHQCAVGPSVASIKVPLAVLTAEVEVIHRSRLLRPSNTAISGEAPWLAPGSSAASLWSTASRALATDLRNREIPADSPRQLV